MNKGADTYCMQIGIFYKNKHEKSFPSKTVIEANFFQVRVK